MVTVTVTGSPDLVASVSPDSVAVAPGGSFEYTVAVRNRGDAAAPATTARAFASADSVVTTSDEMVGEASDVPALGPGKSASMAASMTVSSSASPGTVMWVNECVDPVEEESDTDNNCSAALKVTATGSPDLVASVSPDSVAVDSGRDEWTDGGRLALRVDPQAAARGTHERDGSRTRLDLYSECLCSVVPDPCDSGHGGRSRLLHGHTPQPNRSSRIRLPCRPGLVLCTRRGSHRARVRPHHASSACAVPRRLRYRSRVSARRGARWRVGLGWSTRAGGAPGAPDGCRPNGLLRPNRDQRLPLRKRSWMGPAHGGS